MMLSLFKVSFWLAAVVFLFASLFSACSSPAGTSEGNRVNTSQTTNSPAPENVANSSKQAWEREWDRTLIEAKKERTVVIMGAFGVALARDSFIRTMKDKFGIDADITIAQVPDLLQRIISQRRAGIYQNDIYLAGAISIVGEMLPRELLQPIEPYLTLPEVKDPKSWYAGELPTWGPNREAFFSLMNISSSVAVNKSLVKPEEITSYTDLLKPNLKGKIAMYDPTQPGSGRSWFTMAYRIMGPNYIKDFVKQEPVITRDFRLMTDWLVSGKFAVGIMDPAPITNAKRDGFPVTMLPVLKEGAVIGAGGGQLTIFRDAPHPNAARVFINWLLSKEGMTTFSKAVGMASRRSDISMDHLDAAMMPDPKAKYVLENQKLLEEDSKLQPLAIEIFGPFLNR